MDFMKVFDQTVREIKREVNLKVLKVPEIEQKVLDATDDEPWGPHGTVLGEIADATKKFTECQMVMNVLWTRLSESDQNWRYVYKALTVLEYLVANGSERALDDIIEHSFQISSLLSFECVEPSGKDMGINVRKKVENIMALLNNEDKIQEVRKTAAANRDKYFGVSSTGVTYKSGTACSSRFQSSGRYGGFGSDSFKDSFRDRDQFGYDKFDQRTAGRSSRGVISEKKRNTLKKGSRPYGSKGQNTVASGVSVPATKRNDFDNCTSLPPKSSGAQSNKYEDDDDDFDPRGISGVKSAARSTNQIDLFGQSWIGNPMEAPATAPRGTSQSKSSDIDLFGNSAFVSASPHEVGGRLGTQTKIDLFASQSAPSPAVSAAIDLFASPNPIVQPEKKSPNPDLLNTNSVQPSAAGVPLNSPGGPDFFAAFTSHADDSLPKKPAQSPDSGHNNLNANCSSESRPPPKKDNFGVKSKIWADSLSRGLIDLNISASKETSSADIGIISGLSDGSDGKEKGPSTSFYTGAAMGAGSALGRSTSATAMTGEDFFSNFGSQQYQFGGFQK